MSRDIPLQWVTAASSGTHTHAGAGSRRPSLALSGAPVCGSEELPEGSRRDTGGGLRDVSSLSVARPTPRCARPTLRWWNKLMSRWLYLPRYNTPIYNVYIYLYVYNMSVYIYIYIFPIRLQAYTKVWKAYFTLIEQTNVPLTVSPYIQYAHIYNVSIYTYMYIIRLYADSEAVLDVWLPAPLPTSRAPPGRGALWPLAWRKIWAGSMFDLAV